MTGGYFNIFSKRNTPLPDVLSEGPLNEKFRNQVILLLRPFFKLSLDNYYHDAASIILNILFKEHGILPGPNSHLSEEGDILEGFIKGGEKELALDVIEMSMLGMMTAIKDGSLRYVQDPVDELNHRFRENGLGYWFDSESGKLIPKSNELVHQEVVRPALQLLASKQYKLANEEMLKAFDDYRNGDFSDCLIKCGSAFESVMKVICDEKGWSYQSQATADTLIRIIVTNAPLEPFFTEPIKLIATIRNKMSIAHGQGTNKREVPEHIAQYCLNATATSIMFVHQATR